jgi:hypothetical protein
MRRLKEVKLVNNHEKLEAELTWEVSYTAREVIQTMTGFEEIYILATRLETETRSFPNPQELQAFIDRQRL